MSVHSETLRPVLYRSIIRTLLSPATLILVGLHTATAQGAFDRVEVTAGCRELHDSVMAQLQAGRLAEAESTISPALALGFDPDCVGVILTNIASVLAVSGQAEQAERFAEQAVRILEKSRTSEDRVLLPSLHILAATRIERGQIARAREAYRRLRAVRIEKPEDTALVRDLAGSLFQLEGKWQEAEVEYLAALRAWDAAGRSEMADNASVLTALATLYVQERRLTAAAQTLDQVRLVLQRSKDAVLADHIKLLNVQASVLFLQNDFAKAEQVFRGAVGLADREPQFSPAYQAILLTDFARVLRKNHRNREARRIEARVAALRRENPMGSVIDVTELAASKSARKR